MSTHLFGIRHHGPGCARSLKEALHALQPDCILIEGPPEANDLIPFVASTEMQPPVALLLYVPDAPQNAVYYPFAAFSPEWQALQFAVAGNIPVQFCDLPQAFRLLPAEKSEDSGEDENEEVVPVQELDLQARLLRADPLLVLAQAAGFADTETWWDHLVEQRTDSLDLFAAIAEMMTVVRTEITQASDQLQDQLEVRREAYMRQMLRQAEKAGYQKIAVVCGAYHVPALARMPTARHDADILKGLDKVKIAATWTPWSYGRLAFASGYGAGVEAPGWYHHLWHQPEQAVLFWLSDVANLLRKHDLDASSAHIIEATRLADTLAALRDRHHPGLDEIMEATRAVFCYDSDAPLRLIRRELLLNDRLGAVPADAPNLPLPQNVALLQKKFRMAVRADITELELDLREAVHLEKSNLLYRLSLLGIDWGKRQQLRGKTGTFHEAWRLEWQPDFAIKLIEANIWGSTLETAASAHVIDMARRAQTLPELTKLVERVLLANLGTALHEVMHRVEEVSTLTPDLGYMLAALPALANAMRYGNVRNTDTAAMELVVSKLLSRICIALPVGARGLADEPAAQMVKDLIAADQAVRMLQNDDYLNNWFTSLTLTAQQESSHGLIAGRCARILTEQGQWSEEQAGQQLALHCSHAQTPLLTANWIEGFLQGSGALLIHNDTLWQLINAWLASLNADTFIELLPLLRRTFSSFAAPERYQLGERAVASKGVAALAQHVDTALDESRARLVIPVLQAILGKTLNDGQPGVNV